jgi:hypothetical protein
MRLNDIIAPDVTRLASAGEVTRNEIVDAFHTLARLAESVGGDSPSDERLDHPTYARLEQLAKRVS